MKPLCRHCSRCKVSRPRLLCWHCWYTPGVKELYPPSPGVNRHGGGGAVRGVGNLTGPRPLPDTPTTAAPGTPEKLAVLAYRAKRGQQLFHPADARFEGDPRPLAAVRAATSAAV